MTDEREWPEGVVEEIVDIWTRSTDEEHERESARRRVVSTLNVIASDPEALRALLGEPVAWVVDERDEGEGTDWKVYGVCADEKTAISDRNLLRRIPAPITARIRPLYAIPEETE